MYENIHIVLILILLIIMGFTYSNDEYFTGENEAIHNIVSMYNASMLTATNLTITDTIVTPTIKISDTTTNTITVTNTATIKSINVSGVTTTNSIVNNGTLLNNGTVTIGQSASANNGYPLYVGTSYTTAPASGNLSSTYGVTNSGYLTTPQYATWLNQNGLHPTTGLGLNYQLQVQGFSQQSTMPCSAYFGSSIVTPNLVIISDKRTKKNIASAIGFDTIRNIDVCTYQMCDSNKHINYGLIAQQVEDVCPKSVNTISDFIPNIMEGVYFEECEDLNILIIYVSNYYLNENDIIKIVYLNKTYEVEILEKYDDHLVINKLNDVENYNDSNHMFIIGKKVDDFKTIDYNSIVCLSIGAIKDLYDKMDNQKQQFENKITELENKNNDLELKYNSMLARLEKLEHTYSL